MVIHNIPHWRTWWPYDLALKLRRFIILVFQNPIYLQVPHKNTIKYNGACKKRMLCLNPTHRIVGYHLFQYASIPPFLPSFLPSCAGNIFKLCPQSTITRIVHRGTNLLPHYNSYGGQNIELQPLDKRPLPSQWIKCHYIIICSYWFINIEDEV